MLGVWTSGLPMQPSACERNWSGRMKRMFGGLAGRGDACQSGRSSQGSQQRPSSWQKAGHTSFLRFIAKRIIILPDSPGLVLQTYRLLSNREEIYRENPPLKSSSLG